ncbi:MAG: hypothetical protein VX768_02795 [Planctomycetota bacterium]|nr:hypothetical protein [Planctomycetota bacterium]
MFLYLLPIGLSCFPRFACPLRGDELVLRNYSKIENVTVSRIDEDGVALGDGRSFGLGDIHSASLEGQTQFDELHQKWGLDLFRLRLRIQRQDYENLQPHLGRVYEVYRGRSSRSATLVLLAKYHECICQGDWANAIGVHFRLVTLSGQAEGNRDLLRATGYPWDPVSGMSGWICPFGFEEKKLAEDWPQIRAAYLGLPDGHPGGLDLYFFLLANAVGADLNPEIANRRVKLSRLEQMLLQTLEDRAAEDSDSANRELLKRQLSDYKFVAGDTNMHRALYRFALGQLELKSNGGDRNKGLLNLLRIHAEFRDDFPILAAAALTEVHSRLKSTDPKKNAKSVAGELLSRFPSSIFAKQLRMRSTK